MKLMRKQSAISRTYMPSRGLN